MHDTPPFDSLKTLEKHTENTVAYKVEPTDRRTEAGSPRKRCLFLLFAVKKSASGRKKSLDILFILC